ncbi:MAG: bacteriocin [Thomasclavelia sp.]|jgi:bacteriocin-like protein|nr:bacteriocin [Thomasclavelia sp.]
MKELTKKQMQETSGGGIIMFGIIRYLFKSIYFAGPIRRCIR